MRRPRQSPSEKVLETDRKNWEMLSVLIENEINNIDIGINSGINPNVHTIKMMFYEFTTGLRNETAKRWLRKLYKTYKYNIYSEVSRKCLVEIHKYIMFRI